MSGGCRAHDMIGMMREEGILDLPEGFGVGEDLFVAGLDSMAVMQLIVVVEERYGVVLGPELASVEFLGTPERLAKTIENRR